jgi:F0F1-type ATP synthase assembly protein I
MQNTPPDKPTKPKPSDEDLSGWWRMTGLGVEFMVAVALMGVIGWWADKHFGSTPWLTLVGVGLGFAVGLYGIVRAGMKTFK